METFLAWISVILGVAGLAFGWYQNELRGRIQRLARMQAWEVYQSSRQATGWLNNACIESDINNKAVLLEAARSRADSNYTKTIYNLYTVYDEVTPEMIKTWIETGRIEKESESDFLRYIGEM